MPLEKIDGGIVYPRHDGRKHYSILASTRHIIPPSTSLFILGTAVRTTNSNLAYCDRASLSHAGGFDVSRCSYEDLSTVLANKAVEGRQPLLVFGEQSQREILGGVRLGWRLEGHVRILRGGSELRDLIDERVELIACEAIG